MSMFRHLVLMLFLLGTSHAGSHDQNYYRTFWYPAYHGHRLAYCAAPDKACGLSVANQYCQLMGYERANQQEIDYHVGRTQALGSCTPCKGWQCNGFMLIRCVGKLTHNPVSIYYYRSQEFVFPRYNHSRIDWCYEDGKGCGQRAAYSFCRRMGYTSAQKYKIQQHVSQTMALGNHKLCVGSECNAFSSITCHR